MPYMVCGGGGGDCVEGGVEADVAEDELEVLALSPAAAAPENDRCCIKFPAFKAVIKGLGAGLCLRRLGDASDEARRV